MSHLHMSDYDPSTNRRRSMRLRERAEPMERFVALLNDPLFFDQLIAPHVSLHQILNIMFALPRLGEDPQNRRLQAMNTPISQLERN